MPIKIEVTPEKGISLALQTAGRFAVAVYDALNAKADELGIKCESQSID